MFHLKSKDEIAKMRESGKMLAEVFALIKKEVKPGVRLQELDNLAFEEIVKRSAKPCFKGYQQSEQDPPFPSSLCTSLDSELVHASAARTIVLQEGQIIGIDIGLQYNGWNADMAETIAVSTMSDKAQKLIEVTAKALKLGIKAAVCGKSLVNISQAIYNHVTAHGFGVVTSFVGHGIGRRLHEDPRVPNFPTDEAKDIILKAGLVLALEPMVTAGSPEIEILSDGWTARTKDGSLSAHFEHTIAITNDGPEILTRI